MIHKWPFFDCFCHFFANFMNIFDETEVQTIILRCLVSLNLNWIKSYCIILVKKIFFDAWKCIISGLFCRSEFCHLRGQSAVIFSKWLVWQNSLMISWTTKVGNMQVKKRKYFWMFHHLQLYIYFCDLLR